MRIQKIRKTQIMTVVRIKRFAKSFYKIANYAGSQYNINEAGNEKLDSEEIFEEIITLLHCFSMRHYSKGV